MAQRITIMIAGKSYVLPAKTATEEHYIRLAAERINRTFALYSEKFSSVSDFDKLAFSALADTIVLLKLEKEKAELNSSLSALSSELDSYLKKIEK